MFKPSRQESQTSFVTSVDPAIDWEKIIKLQLDADPATRDSTDFTDAEKRLKAVQAFKTRYQEALAVDPSAHKELFKYKDGQAPTIFYIGVIPSDDAVRIEQECFVGTPKVRLKELHWLAFLHSIRRIENFAAGEKASERVVGGVSYVDPAWLKEKFSRGLRPVAQTVGMASWYWNQLTEVETKN